jgi:hypothetical protein
MVSWLPIEVPPNLSVILRAEAELLGVLALGTVMVWLFPFAAGGANRRHIGVYIVAEHHQDRVDFCPNLKNLKKFGAKPINSAT